MQFRRVYNKILNKKHVLIIEDIVTTGSSANDTIEAVKENGGNVRLLLALISRGTYKPETPYTYLAKKEIVSWAPKNCPYCFKKIPLHDPKLI